MRGKSCGLVNVCIGIPEKDMWPGAACAPGLRRYREAFLAGNADLGSGVGWIGFGMVTIT